jgi:hypothetical protein
MHVAADFLARYFTIWNKMSAPGFSRIFVAALSQWLQRIED